MRWKVIVSTMTITQEFDDNGELVNSEDDDYVDDDYTDDNFDGSDDEF